MTPNEALAYYLGTNTYGTRRDDVIEALQEASRRRHEGPIATAVLIRLAHDDLAMSYRDIQRASTTTCGGQEVCIHQATAQTLARRHATN